MKTTAADHIQSALNIIDDRGKDRDEPDGERAMGKTVAIFAALTGVELTEEQGWKFMIALKFARQMAGDFRLDDYHDLIGYLGLLTETAANAQLTQLNEEPAPAGFFLQTCDACPVLSYCKQRERCAYAEAGE